jgi:hypothetical protein
VKEYIHGKTGREGVYDPAEVERLKAELEAERETVIGKPPALIQQQRNAPPVASATNDERLLMMAARMAQEMMKHLPALLPPAPNGEAPPTDSLSIADKLTLGVADASRLSGLSKESLRTAINAGKLKAKIVAGRRGWTIKRDDLDLYVRKL